METEQIAGSIWKVKSESANKFYTVDLSVPNCTCTDWATKRNKRINQGLSDFYECKHVLAAKAASAEDFSAQQVDKKEQAQKAKIDAKADAIMGRFKKDPGEAIVERFRKNK